MTNETRETLLDQALLLFAKRGYEAVGVQEITAAAGVTKPSLYYHFGSKQGLLSTLLRERLAPMLTALEELVATGEIRGDLVRCAETLFSFAVENSEMYRLFLAFMFASPESPQFLETAVHAKRQYRAIEQLFAGAKTGALQDDVGLLAATFQGALHNYITLFLMGHIQLGRQTAHGATHRFIHGIGIQDQKVETTKE